MSPRIASGVATVEDAGKLIDVRREEERLGSVLEDLCGVLLVVSCVISAFRLAIAAKTARVVGRSSFAIRLLGSVCGPLS